jgi:hypothetical protein
MFPKNKGILPEQNAVFRREIWRQYMATLQEPGEGGQVVPAVAGYGEGDFAALLMATPDHAWKNPGT